MKPFYKLLTGLPGYEALKSALTAAKTPALATGLSHIHKCHFIAGLCQELSRPAMVIAPDEPAAHKLCEDLQVLLGEGAAVLYPAREFTFREMDGVSREYEHLRLQVLSSLQENRIPIVVASAESDLQYTIPPKTLTERTLTLKPGDVLPIDTLLAFLISSGYEQAPQVEGVCQFSHRGGILDVYPPQSPAPVRIEYWGDDVDSISYFSVDTQRRGDPVETLRISPAREVLFDSPEQLGSLLEACKKGLKGKAAPLVRRHLEQDQAHLEAGLSFSSLDRYLPILYPEPATLFDYLGGRMLFLCESANAREILKSAQWQLQEDVKLLLEEGVLFPACSRFAEDFGYLADAVFKAPSLILDAFPRSLPEIPLRELIDITCVQLSSWSGEYAMLREELEDYLKRGYSCLLLAGTERSATAVAGDLRRDGLPADYLKDFTQVLPGKVIVTEGSLSAGVEYPQIKTAMIAHNKSVDSTRRHKPRHKKGEQIRSLSDLAVGDAVVHVSHGIGIFQGIVKQEIQGIAKDYIKIKYAGTDTLFVPVTQLDLVSKYIGPKEEGGVKLNRLNSAEWSKTKQRVKKAVADMAKELVALYAQRAQAKGYAFSPDTDWQRDFEDRFPYEETDDQLRCIDEIKMDMERPIPMERLLCGDVGFGKTEVALRAVFKALMDSKQCAVLVPTTILAWQHFNTFRQRLEGFPVKVDILSRYRTPKQQQQILRELARGEIDVIIGTHRLLQKDVEFKDLGLVVIDEEQRFGVAHKEKLKELKKDIDVLTLSATPIPRTLNMAMSGVRDMSVIEEAPADRHPVQTYVTEHDWGIVAEAIKRELRRGGQVFYLHNHIGSIESCAAKIAALVPDARIVTAHGRMGEEELSRVWRQLVDHEIDILVCTTIIETGVDVANCNTLIIENADRMGLSQLYQLRGRVGRSSRRAYAYLTFQGGRELSDIAAKRLSAIREFTTFGSGFRIAMRDLEIRGAGNILGAQQHGHMESGGYDMYIKLLSEAVLEEKGELPPRPEQECLIDIRIGAHIPESYINDLSSRIDVYKKIAAIRNKEDMLDVTDELIDRFGDPPKAVKGLIDVALVRNMAEAMGIYEISQQEDRVLFYPQQLDFRRVGGLSAKFKGRVQLEATGKPCIQLKLERTDSPIEVIQQALAAMNAPPEPENSKPAAV